MIKRTTLLAAGLAALALSLHAADAPAAAPRKIVLGVVAKSQSNPVFQAARLGAEAAAKDLSKKYNANITIDWRTPNDEDAQKQADNIAALVNNGVTGIAVSASDANKVTPAINDAVNKGVPVVTFDSDAPASKRFATYAVDDEKCGRQVMTELVKVMGEKGVVAILAGNQNAPNLQKRVAGAKAVAAKYPNLKVNVYYNVETPQDAAQKVEQVTQANPEITGWAMIGGWPLFTKNALKFAPGTIKVVSVDALPAELDYLRDGHVQMLLAQQCYQWGYQGVSLLVDDIINKKRPAQAFVESALIPVSKDNVEAFAKESASWFPK